MSLSLLSSTPPNPDDRRFIAEGSRPLVIALAMIATAVAGLMLWYFVQLIHMSMARGAALRAEQQQAVTAEVDRWRQPAASVAGMVVQPPPPTVASVRLAGNWTTNPAPVTEDDVALEEEHARGVSRMKARLEEALRFGQDDADGGPITRSAPQPADPVQRVAAGLAWSDPRHAPAAFTTAPTAEDFAGIAPDAVPAEDRVMALSR